MKSSLRLPDAILLEGIVTTENPDGSYNISPMGPVVDWPITRLRLRPYKTSTTYANLARTGCGVFNLTDDVELIARAAIGKLESLLSLASVRSGGKYLADGCAWYAFAVDSLGDTSERADIECQVVEAGRLRDFCGFNRAKNAVIEAAILATRVGILPDQQILADLHRLASLVEKTGSQAEHRAFRLLTDYVERTIADSSRPAGADA